MSRTNSEHLATIDHYGSNTLGPCYYVNGQQVAKDTYEKVRKIEAEVERLRGELRDVQEDVKNVGRGQVDRVWRRCRDIVDRIDRALSPGGMRLN